MGVVENLVDVVENLVGVVEYLVVNMVSWGNGHIDFNTYGNGDPE